MGWHGLFLLYLGDPNHDPWNEVKLSAAVCGMMTALKLLIIVANLFYAPFDSAGFWAKVSDGAAKYKRVATSKCPIFQFLLPHMAFESGETDRLGMPGYAEEVFDELVDDAAIRAKGVRMAMCRFHCSHHVWAWLKDKLYRRLCFSSTCWSS